MKMVANIRRSTQPGIQSTGRALALSGKTACITACLMGAEA